MKSNASKSHVWVTTKNIVYIKIENCGIKNCYDEKILGVAFDHRLTFYYHISDLSKKNYE